MADVNNTASSNDSRNELEQMSLRMAEMEIIISGMRKINESIASLTIDETYKNFYEWRVKPAVDMIALLSSSASNTATVADIYSKSVFVDKHDVKKAFKISEKILDQIEVAIKLYEVEIECLIEANDKCDEINAKRR